MNARSVRRLPGVQFEGRPPRLPDVLPRMDVAIFVGFASSGPLHTPVAVDDPGVFLDLFGDDAPLAWDRERCELVNANLGPAVRAFFRNGGSRCWVVRVARTVPPAVEPNNQAVSNHFAVPGLVRLSGPQLAPAFVAARSEGSWSDPLGVGAAIQLQPSTVQNLTVAGGLVVSAQLDAPDTVEVGDVLRLTWPTGDAVLAPVASFDGDVAIFTTDPMVWQLAGSPAAGAPVWSASWFPRPDGIAEALPSLDGDPTWNDDGTVTLALAAEAAPQAGQMLRLTRAGEQVWVVVDDSRTVNRQTSPPSTGTSIEGRFSRVAFAAPAGLLSDGTPTVLVVGERVRVELWVRTDGGHPIRLGDLGLAPGQPSYFGALPTDRRLFEPDEDLLSDDEKALRDRVRALVGDGADLASYHQNLWTAVANPRFPLAVDAGRTDLFLPLVMPIVADEFLAAAPLPGDPAERDGLANFGSDLFLDPDLADDSSLELPAQSDFLRWQQPSPRRLLGIHAAFAVDEATLIAVPDAIQRGWSREQVVAPTPFATPVITAATDDAGNWTLTWTAVDPDASYVLEEATTADFTAPVPVTLPSPSVTSYAVPASTTTGRSWFRVRAYQQDLSTGNYFVVGNLETAGSFWSDPVAVTVPPQQFVDCPPGALGVPTAELIGGPDVNGSYQIGWSAVAGAIGYEVQESDALDFSDAATVFLGDATEAWLYGRAPGRYHDRVRARGSLATVSAPISLGGDVLRFDVTNVDTAGHIVTASYAGAIGDEVVFDGSAFTENFSGATNARSSLFDGYRYVLSRDGGWPGAPTFRAWAPDAVGEWSNGVAVTVAPPPRRVLNPADSYALSADKSSLLAVQAALLRLCAARGDLVAVLGLPEHYRENEAVKHVTEVRSLVPEETPWSYGALYHPWVMVEGDVGLLRAPPDGAACGVMAKRAVARGAWIAPANEPMGDVLGLTPPISRDQWGRLLDAHVNVVRQEPHGFVTLSADTLADDPDLTPLNVRRLLILLRRAAMRLGPTFVFEPNSDIFRRSVERGFEAMLETMFRAGAFAGATPDQSYQVVVDASINTQTSLDLGRFIVELKVAPSLPLQFLTVRLVQSGDRGQASETR